MINWRSEFKKCISDVTRKYMIEKYIFEQDLLDSQKIILEQIKTHNTVAISKSRDIGYTSIMAAYVACELVLNSDTSFNILYIACNGQSSFLFRKKVREYLSMIPSQLYTDEYAKIGYYGNKGIKFGNAQAVIISGSDERYIIEKTCSLTFECAIFDEVAFLEDLDINHIVDVILKPICNLIIIGSTPNHNNLNWYNFVKILKDKGQYIEIPWFLNQKHQADETDKPVILCDSEHLEFYYSNKWLEKRRFNYVNEDIFNEEYNARVWKYKTVKEYA